MAASVPPEKVAELGQLLKQLLVPDNHTIRQAYELLKGFFRDARVVIALVHLIVGCPEWEVRQLAAVLLRQRLIMSWRRMSPDLKSQIKNALLTRVATDEKPLVRQSVANVVAAVAKFEVPAKQWPELLDFLLSLFRSTTVSHREIGFYLLSLLAESMADQLRPALGPLMETLAAALRDPESNHVRINSLMAIKDIGFQLQTKTEIEKYQQLVPLMLQTLQDFVAANDDEGSTRAVEAFDELLECEVPILAKHMGAVLKSFIHMACNTNLEESSRIKALSFLAWAAEFKPKSVVKHKLAHTIVVTLFQLVTEDDSHEGPDENEGPAHGDRLGPVAANTLATLADNVPADQIIPPLFECVQKAYTSANVQERKASMLCLGTVVEGCSEYIRPHIGAMMSMVLACLNDPSPVVQEDACFALSRFGEHIQPESSEFHQQVIPALFAVIDSSVPKIRELACMTLEIFCEQLGEAILPYLNPLMEKLISLLQSSGRNVQETVVCAIGSVAHSAEHQFQPYLAAIVQTLSTAMQLHEPEDIELRALATDTMGTVATAVGLSAFGPYIEGLVNLVMQGISTIDEARIRESSWMFFASIARLTEAQFAPFLPTLIPLIITSANREVDVEVDDDDEMQSMASNLVAEGEDITEEDREEADESNLVAVKAITMFVDEKEMAVGALGEICLHVGTPFLPYVQECLSTFVELLNSDHSDVRQASVVSIGQFMRSFNNMYMGGVPWQDTHVGAIKEIQMLAEIMPHLMRLLATDDSMEVCTTICQVVSDNIPVLGPMLLVPYQDILGVNMLKILNKQLPCQETFDDDDDERANDDETEESESEKKGLLIDAAADVIGAAAGVTGPTFAPYFQTVFPILQKYYKPRRPVSDRSLAIGCVAEVLAGIKEGATPFVPALVPFLFKALQDADDEVQRNAIYALGCLCEGVGAAMLPHYQQILQVLRPMFSPQQREAVVDNACAAVSRMILASPGALPLDQVVPVILDFLPLREDFEENDVMVSMLLLLIAQETHVVMSAMARVLSIFARMLGPPMEQLKPRTRQNLVGALKELALRHQQSFASLLAALPDDDQTVLQSVLHT